MNTIINDLISNKCFTYSLLKYLYSSKDKHVYISIALQSACARACVSACVRACAWFFFLLICSFPPLFTLLISCMLMNICTDQVWINYAYVDMPMKHSSLNSIETVLQTVTAPPACALESPNVIHEYKLSDIVAFPLKKPRCQESWINTWA